MFAYFGKGKPAELLTSLTNLEEKPSRIKTCIYFNPVKIIEHLQELEIWHVKKKIKRKLSFKIISGEGPVISTQKHQLLNDILRSSTVSQSNNITESTSNFLQVTESSPIRNEPWYLTGQTVPSYATAAIVSCFSLEQ